jgi:hypothetical protein
MEMPSSSRPGNNLTREMTEVLERMVFTQSVAIVRIGSQWWAAENDLPVAELSPEEKSHMADAAPRRDRDRLMYEKPVFWTGTVKALVTRRKLKWAGGKRRVNGGSPVAQHHRAMFRTDFDAS